MRILELCVILLEKKKKREKKIHTGVELYIKSDTACSESGCATAFPRFPCRNFSRQFVYEGGKRVRGGVFSSPLPPLPPPPRNFFNIRIRVGPPTRAQSLSHVVDVSRYFAFESETSPLAKQNPPPSDPFSIPEAKERRPKSG